VIKSVAAKDVSAKPIHQKDRPDHNDVLQMVKKYQQTGCQRTLTWIVRHHQDMCWSIANRYEHRFEVDDTYQDCMESLIHAIKEFDVDCGYAFFSQTYIRVSREIARKKIRQWNIVTLPDNKELLKVFRHIKEMAIPAYPSKALAQEIANTLEVKIEYVHLATVFFHKRALSLDSGVYSDLTNEAVRASLVDDCSPESIVTEADFEANCREVTRQKMGLLSEKEALVIRLRHLQEPPLKLREVGDELGITAARVQQIEMKAMGKMKHAA
jgi:RNA polymerase sigma-32 factor